MLQHPDETWNEYCARYRDAWSTQRHRLFKGTAALAGGKTKMDISRDEEDYFAIDENYEQLDHFHIGYWITGFGFFNVAFPKGTSRPVTDEEFEWFLDHPVVMA